MHFKILSMLCRISTVLYISWTLDTKPLPSARLAWCCPLIQSRWPTARWGSKRSLRSLRCVRRGWTKEKQSRGITNAHDNQLKKKKKKNPHTQRGSTATVFVSTNQQLRRTVLSILWWLLLSDLAEVPDVEPPVSAAGGQDGFVVRWPLNLSEGEMGQALHLCDNVRHKHETNSPNWHDLNAQRLLPALWVCSVYKGSSWLKLQNKKCNMLDVIQPEARYMKYGHVCLKDDVTYSTTWLMSHSAPQARIFNTVCTDIRDRFKQIQWTLIQKTFKVSIIPSKFLL